MTLKTFAPNGQATVQIAATPASARVAVDPNSAVVRVYNAGPDTAYICFGDSTVASTVNQIPLVAGSPELFTKGQLGYVAAICDTAKAATIYITSGEGM